MTPRFILLTTAAILLAACDRNSAVSDAAKTAELEKQRQAEQAANEKIRALEERIDAADKQKAADKDAEFARVKEELAQVKKDREAATERLREIQEEEKKLPPVAQEPVRVAEAPMRVAEERERAPEQPRATAVHADLERTVEDEEDREPVYVGRVVPETQRVASVQTFYEPLDPYGDWVETDDYGYVFRPTVATRGDWRPYTDGHWVHTGHGWTWQSNEDFGWATYHYGRWTRIERTGWVWVPGREWGPGWVSWRRGNDHCGWAPLPPESRSHVNFTATVDRDYDIGPAAYVFVALSNFGARSYAPVIERPEQNVTIINKTVNVTNITYDNSVNKTVVYNGGPSYDFIRSRSQQPVENVNVNFAPQNSAINKRTKIVNLRQGDTLQVAAPPVALAAPPVPLHVKEKLGKPKMDHGWAGVDPAQAQKMKQEIAETSTERKRKPKLIGEAGMPAPVKPAAPPVTVPSVMPAKPERPSVAAPEPPKPAKVEKPAPLIPEAVKPNPMPETLPKVVVPETTGEVKKPRVRNIEPVPPKPTPETLPKVTEPDPVKPKHFKETPDVPQPKREKPVMPKFQEPVDAPVNKAPVEQPLRVKQPKPDRPAIPPAPEPPRVPKSERPAKVIAPENPAPVRVKKQFVPDAPPAPQRIVQPPQAPVQRAPQPNPQPAIDAERQREKQMRKQQQQNPVIQRAPQPPPPQGMGTPIQPAGENSEKKKKKDKDKEEGR